VCVCVQGSSDPNRELLDAQALVGHLVAAGTVCAFLAEHRQRVFPDELFAERNPITAARVAPSRAGRRDRAAVGKLRREAIRAIGGRSARRATGVGCDRGSGQRRLGSGAPSRADAERRPARSGRIPRPNIATCGVRYRRLDDARVGIARASRLLPRAHEDSVFVATASLLAGISGNRVLGLG
jgi:hypothetical protein